MIIVRDVFQAGYGKGGELVALLEEARQQSQEKWGMSFAQRILTDASGPFFTVVTETEMASIGEWEQTSARVFSLPEFADWFARMVPLVESGRREFYHLEG
ncbi:MAG: hypothetical protein DLM69_11020 [Candidatus Chloroheliales bacterium]|nr:MAG: hypothetical protein DLM69_11020 [Chloroflexota bacterium]